jgi:hypothetical protein
VALPYLSSRGLSNGRGSQVGYIIVAWLRRIRKRPDR